MPMTYARPELELVRRDTGSPSQGTREFVRAATAIAGHRDTCDFNVGNYATHDVGLDAALVYIVSLGGGELYVDEGDYNLAATVDFPGDNLFMSGAGRNTVLNGAGVTDRVIQISNRNHCTVRDLAILNSIGDRGGIRVNDSDEISIINCYFEIDSATGYGIDTPLNDTSSNLVIKDNEFTSGQGMNLFIDENGSALIEGNHIHDVTRATAGGIRIVDVGSYIIKNNHIHDLTGTLDAFGIWLYLGRAVIEGNNIHDISHNGIYVSTVGYAIVATPGFDIIVDNTIGVCGQNGIFLVTADDVVIRLNVIYDCTQYGINISNAACDLNVVKDNRFNGNTLGPINDLGTDTCVHWFFKKVSNPNSTMGDHHGVQMPDGVDTTVPQGDFYLPLEIQQIVTVEVSVLQIADAASGDMVWTVATDYGVLGTGDYDDHSDTAGATSAITQDLLVLLDVSAAFTVGPAGAGDLIGFQFTRDGDDGSDDLAATALYIGIRVRYV